MKNFNNSKKQLSDLLPKDALKEIMSTIDKKQYDKHLLLDEILRVVEGDKHKIGLSTYLDFQKSIDRSQAHIYVGLAVYRLGEVRDAIDEYQKALSLNPKNDIAWFNLGQAQYNLGSELFESGNRTESLKLLRNAKTNLQHSSCNLMVTNKVIPVIKYIDHCLSSI